MTLSGGRVYNEDMTNPTTTETTTSYDWDEDPEGRQGEQMDSAAAYGISPAAARSNAAAVRQSFTSMAADSAGDAHFLMSDETRGQ